jgi:integrase
LLTAVHSGEARGACWSEFDLDAGVWNIPALRSTFRDWASECTHYPNELLEMALAHQIGNAVEAAYRRGDMAKVHPLCAKMSPAARSGAGSLWIDQGDRMNLI